MSRVIQGDCLTVLPTLAEASVDAVICDPPYGLRFMSSQWDHGVPGVEYWREALRVAKPGAHLVAFGGTRTYHRLTCAIEDAGWEIRDCLMWLYGCLDADTDCLTRRGWVKYHELSTADEVLQWEATTGALSWVQPEEIIVRRYDGPMVRLKNRHTDQLVTPDHRVYARVRQHGRGKATEYSVTPAADLRPSWSKELPVAGLLAGVGGPSPDLAYLVGWWLTDAWTHSNGKAAMFTQSKPATLAKLRAALAPHPHTEHQYPTTHLPRHIFYVNGDLAAHLLREYPRRELTWDMLSWGLEARQALFNGLMDGDGSQPSTNGHVFWSRCPERRAVFLALAVTLGYRAFENTDHHCVNVNRARATTHLSHRHWLPPEHYHGDVWCLRVPQGAFVVRRSGRPFITGNSGFPKSLDVSKAMDKAAGVEREIVGPGRYAGRGRRTDNAVYGEATPSEKEVVSAPATDLAKQWSGWGTALKPAWEPIILARKPLIGTVAANVAKHGTGGLNIDGCRISGEPWKAHRATGLGSVKFFTEGEAKEIGKEPHAGGRWPANVVLDEAAAALLDAQSGKVGGGDGKPLRIARKSESGSLRAGGGMNVVGNAVDTPSYADSGGASRFYYCAKASRMEREAGLAGLATQPAGALSGRQDGSLEPVVRANHHPTVKPLALMRWLCRSVTPPGGLVLDPFCGSGSTGCASVLEGFDFIGIDLDAGYCAIAQQRIEHWAEAA